MNKEEGLLSSLLSGIDVSQKGRGASTDALKSCNHTSDSKNLHTHICQLIHNTTTALLTNLCIQTRVLVGLLKD